jgi:pyruvate dehydrogenase E2 component (dihydrolipoamide acetyltransferase)
MAQPVIMPKQGQSVESCLITEWYKKKDEKVQTGDLLFAYETDKASFEEEAKTEGILLEIFYEEGDEVPVLSNVAVIGKQGESIEEFRPGSSAEVQLKPDKENVESIEKGKTGDIKVIKKEPAKQEEDKIKISPRAIGLAKKLGVDYSNIIGSGPYKRIIERDIEALAKSRPRITPLARILMEKEKLVFYQKEIEQGRRITSKDLIKKEELHKAAFEDVPLSKIRKIIAEGTYRSLQNSAQLTHHTSADASRILTLRQKMKEQMEKSDFPNITLNDMICFAVIKALKKYPDVNTHFLGDKIRKFYKVNLAIAVDTERGLLVPTVLNADDYSLTDLSYQMKELTEKCYHGNINPDLLSSESATFTVSNLGVYGVEMFTPVLNIPQVGILGINTIIKRPVDLGEGIIGLVPYLGLSLTYDHRALDGGPASLFLKQIKEEIEYFEEEIES